MKRISKKQTQADIATVGILLGTLVKNSGSHRILYGIAAAAVEFVRQDQMMGRVWGQIDGDDYDKALEGLAFWIKFNDDAVVALSYGATHNGYFDAVYNLRRSIRQLIRRHTVRKDQL